MAVRSYAGAAKRTNLAGDITATSTNILVVDATGYPTGVDGPFAIALALGNAAEEKILIASRSGNTLTVATGGRGYDGTTSAEHRTGVTVDHVLTATDVREANAHVNDTTGDPHPQYLTPTEASAAYVAKADETWQRLAEVRLGTNGSFTLGSIPATYRHLRLVVAGRSTNASADDGVFMRFNGDATAVYDWQTLRASGTAVSATEGIGQTYLDVGRLPAGNAPTGIAGSLVIDIPDYAQASLHKTFVSANTNKRDAVVGGLDTRQHSGAWRSTAAINQIAVAALTGSLLSGTVATLYGMKGVA